MAHVDVVTVGEANILLMHDVYIVDGLDDGAVVGLFPLDEMRPVSSIS